MSRPIYARITRVLAVFVLALLGTAADAVGAPTSMSTTAPQAVRLDSVVLGNKGIRLAFTEIQRGDLVVFKVHNASASSERFVILPVTVGLGPSQSGTGFRTKLLKPGELVSFEVEFQTRETFQYSVVNSKGKKQANGKFLVV